MKYKLLRFSLLSMLVMLFAGWSQSAFAADKWVKTSPSQLNANDKVVIVDLKSSKAMSNNGGTSSAPSAVSVTLSKDQSEITGSVTKLAWIVELDKSTFKFFTDEDAENQGNLYVTKNNNGVRVGSGARNVFTIVQGGDNNGYYLFNEEGDDKRYIGVYNESDWRCYTSINSNIKGNNIAFFVQTADADDTRLVTAIELANVPTEGVKGSSVSAPTATIVDASGAPVTEGGISWSSSNENVAYVSDATLYFVGPGTATITASFEGNTNYKPSSESFSVTVTAEPYTTFRDLQADVSGTSVPISFTFSGQQVVFVNGKNAFIADGQGFGALVYTDGHGLVAGEKLTGTINCNMVLYQGNTEITGFDKSKLTTATADVVPVEKAIADVQKSNQSTLITLKGVTYNAADNKFADAEGNTITFYDKFQTKVAPEAGKLYDVTGIVVLFNDVIEICPRTADDLAEAGSSEQPAATVLENILALKNFVPSGDEPEDVVLTLNNAKVTLVDAEGDRIIFEDASAGYFLEGSGLSSQLKAGQTLNGTMSFTAEADYFGSVVLTLTDSKFTTTDGELTPLEVTENNVDDYAENYDYRLAKFASASIKVQSGTYGDDVFLIPDVLSGMEIGIMDLFGMVSEMPADGAKVEATGWIINYMGMLTFFQPLSITEITDEPPADDREIIKWNERDVAGAGQTAKSYSSPNQKITLEITDTDGKLSVDGNNCWFGDEETQEKFTHRLKTGGKSSSKNALSMTVAEAGTLKIYVRTGSNSATDRNLVLTQDGVELLNQVILESDAIKVKGMDSSDPDKETNVYPIISVPVAAGTVAITYPTNSLNFYAFEFVAGGEDTPEIPENAIWTSDKAEQLTWDQENVAIAADKFANAKVGDIIRVHLQNVKTGAANAWDAQVGLRAQNGKDLEFLVNVAGVTGSAPAEYADFLITGDILAILQSIGAQIYGNECQTALVTLEGSNYTGSAESIWIGSTTDNVTISPNHFANANNFEGVKVGDIIRVTFDTPNWLGMNYQSPSWTWSEFPDGSFEMVYDWTNPVADFVVKTEEAAAILNNTENAQIVVNAGGSGNPKTITQVELIPGTEEEKSLYLIGDMNGWNLEQMIELGYNSETKSFEYEVSPTGNFYFAVSDVASAESWDAFAEHRYAIGDGNNVPTLDQPTQLAVYANGTIMLYPGSYKISISDDMVITVTGEIATTEFQIESVYAAGEGPGNWLNGVEWDSAAEVNKMTETTPGVWTITFPNVPAGEGYKVKFTVNGSWDVNFGGTMPDIAGEQAVAISNGDNIAFTLTKEQDVTLILDLSEYNNETKEGAYFTVMTSDPAVTVADIAAAKSLVNDDLRPTKAIINLKKAKVTFLKKMKLIDLLNNINILSVQLTGEESFAKPAGMFRAPKKAIDINAELEFAIIEDESGAMPIIGCDLAGKDAAEGSELDGNIVVQMTSLGFATGISNDLTLGGNLTQQSVDALTVTDGTATPREITTDNADEYKSNFDFLFVKFSKATLETASTDEEASMLDVEALGEEVVIGDLVDTGALATEDGDYEVEGFLYQLGEFKVFQPTKMESTTTGISSVRFFENAKGTVYNLNGQRVTTPQKGVMIVNGKKVVVK